MSEPTSTRDAVAAAIAATHIPAYYWHQISEEVRDRFRRMADAALAVMDGSRV
jgi:S-adenosylhomocysteine hydrolase